MFRGVGNRGGVRGGKDQFNWDEVRGDKYKEFYLGQATRIQGDNWWNRGQSLQHAVKGLEQTKQNVKTKTTDLELAAIKQQEQQLMLEALGLKPKTRRDPTRNLDKHEFRDLIKKGSLASERDETDVNRVGGLGFEPAPHVTSEGIEMATSVFLPKYSENADDEDQVTKLEAGEGGIPMHPRRVVGPFIPRMEEKKEKKEKKHKKEKKSKKEKKEKRKDREEDSRQSPKRVKSDNKEDRSRDDRRDRDTRDDRNRDDRKERDTRDERSRDDHREDRSLREIRDDRREERKDRDTRDDRSRDDRRDRDRRDDRSRDDRRDDRSGSRRERRDY